MIWKVKDPNRWRKGFAFFPKTIGNRRIWLSRYAWRPLPEEDHKLLLYQKCCYEEFSLPCGYIVWKKYVYYTGLLLLSESWVKPKPTLKVVNQ